MNLINADCLEALKGLPDCSVDAVVTDPPAGIGFMGKDWDKDKGGRAEWIAWLATVMAECRRVLKPGGHGLVWALPRTSHWTAMALEDAGFEVRDCLVHIFGSGFPKSKNVALAIDKGEGHPNRGRAIPTASTHLPSGKYAEEKLTSNRVPEYEAKSEAAKQWDGWGTALKPASEHWWLVRKPLVGTVAANVLEHGTGALNIDGCRVAYASAADYEKLSAGVQAIKSRGGTMESWTTWCRRARSPPGDSWKNSSDLSGANDASTLGRWPPNLLLSHTPECQESCADACPVAEMNRQSGPKKASFVRNRTAGARPFNNNGVPTDYVSEKVEIEESEGGASRFFPVFRYQAKASRSDRGENNRHPTVKSVALMEWLIRLVTPPGGVVLDPFMGSGTTGVAAAGLGFDFIGIEREAAYFEICKARVLAAKPVQAQKELFA